MKQRSPGWNLQHIWVDRPIWIHGGRVRPTFVDVAHLGGVRVPVWFPYAVFLYLQGLNRSVLRYRQEMASRCLDRAGRRTM